MNIGQVQSAAASFTLTKSLDISRDQMEQLLAASQQIKQAPANLKMVDTINRAVENGHIDLYA